MFRKILIANRGEIAVRIARACREVGVRSVAIYSEADRTAPHVCAADEAVCVGPALSRDSYLNVSAILAAASATSAEAVHPGYGFLSENAAFAQAVVDRGLTFIGPTPAAIAAMGDKTAAKARVAAAGVPVLPAVENPPADSARLTAAVSGMQYPLLVKAAAGGGGRGMRRVASIDELAPAIEAAEREAHAAFGDGRVFIERYLERPRHIEVQILADTHGRTIHLGERECSIQRRHQKIIEEAPSPSLNQQLRARLTAAALAAARSVQYHNAGTVEFMVTDEGELYFLEMNTRLQVEHPVTELVWGIDLVQAQIRIAAGEPLWLTQDEMEPRGHAIESRICAENPAAGFLPCPGRIAALHVPVGPGVRFDSGIAAPYEIPVHYDSLLAKLSVWGQNRNEARHRMLVALRELAILGVTTTVPYLREIIRHPAFAAGETHTHFLEQHFGEWRAPHDDAALAAIGAALHTLLAAPETAAASSGATALPTPWHQLGAWRLGGA
jgi:acetyl-CoA carboxylase biotin carboxylase subunit